MKKYSYLLGYIVLLLSSCVEMPDEDDNILRTGDWGAEVCLVSLVIIAAIGVVMVCYQLSSINEKLAKLLSSVKESESEESSESENPHVDDEFYKGQLVVRLSDETQLVIESFNEDNTVKCRLAGTENVLPNAYRFDEIEDFRKYWNNKKKKD
jgi:hypothetical protein